MVGVNVCDPDHDSPCDSAEPLSSAQSAGVSNTSEAIMILTYQVICPQLQDGGSLALP